MAASDTNIVILSGRLTRDPEARGGGKVAAFSIASNRYFRASGSDETTEEVVFADVTAFGYEAEAVLSKLLKGAPVQVEGRLELNRWQDGEGNNRQQLRIIANRVTSPALRSTASAPQTEAEPVQEPVAEPVAAMATSDDIPF